MRVLRPDMAVWLLALPLVFVCWLGHFWWKWRSAARGGLGKLPGHGGGDPLSRRTTRRRDGWILVVALASVTFITLALMRPQWQTTERQPTFERRDLVILLDRSVSMRARDVAPARFTRAVEEIQRFLERKPATIDRVALIGFASAAVVLSYPTADVDSLAFYLDWAEHDQTLFFGTDIGAALTSALDIARRDGQRVPPVFVIISDGDDQSGRLDAAAAAVARAGIRIHTIGIGTTEPVPMPVAAGDGREEFLRDDYGELLTTRFEGRALQRVAMLTGGQAFRSTAGGELLAALEDIGDEERRQVGTTVATTFRELYPLALAAAAVASLALVMLL